MVRTSFHDPDGSVFLTSEGVRRIMESHAAQRVDAFLATKAYQRLADATLIPRTARVDAGELPAELREQVRGDAVWYRHERLPFISYPHEWSPDQLLAACRLTLELAETLRADGWDIKDGNARNVVFRGSSPVFVDFGSFEPRDDSTPVWRPSGQLQRHFLLPLLAHLKLGLAPSQLLMSHPDGLTHEEAYQCLRSARLRDRHVFWLCTLPAMLGRFGGPAPSAPNRLLDAVVCRAAADRTVRSLRRRVDALEGKLGAPNSRWAGYAASRPHYTAEQLAVKHAAVDRILARLRPVWLLDIGTNGGEYANLAASHGCEVVSIDTDVDALRVARQASADAGRDVLHLHVDFAAPTPALGWNGAECQSFDQRCVGRFDLVMALAVMHHVLVAGRIPLEEAVAKLASYSRGHVLVEYVDRSDPMFDAMARQRGSDFSALDRAAFMNTLDRHFDIEECVEVIPNRRALFLCALRRP